MRTKIVLFILSLFFVAPLIAADLEAVTSVSVSPSATAPIESADSFLEAEATLEPVSLRELVEGFKVPMGFGGQCGQNGSCNMSPDCYWMRRQCVVGTFPQCSNGTSSGCEGTCYCGWG